MDGLNQDGLRDGVFYRGQAPKLREEVDRLKKENEALKKVRRNSPLIRVPESKFEALLSLPELTDGDQEDYMDGICSHPWESFLDLKTTHRINKIHFRAIKRISTTDLTIHAYQENEES